MGKITIVSYEVLITASKKKRYKCYLYTFKLKLSPDNLAVNMFPNRFYGLRWNRAVTSPLQDYTLGQCVF